MSVHTIIAKYTDATYGGDVRQKRHKLWESWQTVVGDLAGCLSSVLSQFFIVFFP